ncbi:MAG: DHA2 family efflux MFS transporter permease subunit [Actinomycetota bacterium]|nr:DHA2 family efflux MFS transporter permease subunit [Actinomycetota bacterium]
MVQDGYDFDKRWRTLAVLCLSLVIVVVGNTVLNVALPTLVRELGATSSQLQWIVDSYALVFAGLLLTAGALGDRFGRKGALTAGLVIFGVASGVSAFATSADQLVTLRAVMGVGAALIMPATLSILTNVFPPQERARAIAIWAGLAGAGAAFGPIASGFLLEHFGWGSVFLVNLPVVAAALIGGRLLVPRSKDTAPPPLDPVGAVLSIAGLGALLYGIIEGPNHGWTDAVTLAWLTGGLAILVLFGLWERRSTHPMLDLRFFRSPTFSSAAGAITLIFFAMFGTFFLFTQYLQLVLGYGTLEAGVRMLPMAFTMMVAAPSSARLVERFGARRVVTTGLCLVAAGLLLLSTAAVDTPYWRLVLNLVVLAGGMGLSMAPSTTGIMASLPLGKAGVGSAVNDTTRELGGALGVAVLGSLLASRYASSLSEAVGGLVPAPALEAAKSSLGGALGVARSLGGPAGESVAAAARSAFVDAMSTSLTVAAAVVLLAALLVSRYYPERIVVERSGAHARAGTEPEAA